MAAKDHLNWDQHYGKTFKWGYVPEGRWTGPAETPKSERIGLIAKHSAADWDDWEDAIDHPSVQEWKNNWKSRWDTLPKYKKDQLLDSASKEKGE